MERLKKIAGVTAAQYVKDGMVVGLGTGSTAYFFVEEIGRRMKEEGLKVVGVTTSSQTTAQAEGLGIPLKAVDDIDVIDVTVDGADEVDTNFNGIKGGGGALLMEKSLPHQPKNTSGLLTTQKWSINSVPLNCQSKWFNMVQTVFSVSSRKRLQTVLSHGKW